MKRSRSRSIVRAAKVRKLQHEVASTLAPSSVLPTGAERSKEKQDEVTLFEAYIRKQAWLPYGEINDFVRVLSNPLPVTFRIRSDEAKAIFSKKHLPRIRHIAHELPGNAWQVDRCSDLLRQWLVTCQASIVRQETVSMLPVWFLRIEKHHHVLDLCASPGSKTMQAVDLISNQGLVVANEIDPKRAYVLAHRCRAQLGDNDMCKMAVVCHNATKFPNVLAPLVYQATTTNSSAHSPLPYDRIICDVPCSGDGTLRKDIKVWKTWHPSYGIQLHSLQLRIAKRGIALLKIGGYMTYSTCSFHPIENEAIVAALLATGTVVLERPKLTGVLKARPGLANWKVLDDELQECSHEKYPSTLWPPQDSAIYSELSKCVRMVPQDNNTGGFFIALLRKVKEFSVKNPRSGTTRKPSLVTPTASQHVMRARTGSNDSALACYTRTHSEHGRVFELTPSLSAHLMEQPGSTKLNLVYAGRYVLSGLVELERTFGVALLILLSWICVELVSICHIYCATVNWDCCFTHEHFVLCFVDDFCLSKQFQTNNSLCQTLQAAE
jgi:tRNA (cytosine34-C5)-methyltransferase